MKHPSDFIPKKETIVYFCKIDKNVNVGQCPLLSHYARSLFGTDVISAVGEILIGFYSDTW